MTVYEASLKSNFLWNWAEVISDTSQDNVRQVTFLFEGEYYTCNYRNCFLQSLSQDSEFLFEA